jgi:hypothetical protein
MTDKATQKTFRQVCTCENCGNEAEMIITCSLEPVEEETRKETAADKGTQQPRKKIPGQATCTRCGNEAEILVDY